MLWCSWRSGHGNLGGWSDHRRLGTCRWRVRYEDRVAHVASSAQGSNVAPNTALLGLLYGTLVAYCRVGRLKRTNHSQLVCHVVHCLFSLVLVFKDRLVPDCQVDAWLFHPIANVSRSA